MANNAPINVNPVGGGGGGSRAKEWRFDHSNPKQCFCTLDDKEMNMEFCIERITGVIFIVAYQFFLAGFCCCAMSL